MKNKRFIAVCLCLAFLFAFAGVTLASDFTDSSKEYNITRLGAYGTLWSLSTVKRNATYNDQMYVCSVITFSTLDGGSGGHFTTRPYLSKNGAVASDYVSLMSASETFNGGSLLDDYPYTQTFIFKFVGNDNFAIAATGRYAVGHSY